MPKPIPVLPDAQPASIDALLQGGADFVALLDGEDLIIDWRSSAPPDQSRQDATPRSGQSWLSLWAEADRARMLEALALARQGTRGRVRNLQGNDDGAVWFDVVIVPATWSSKAGDHVLAVAYDVTERHLLQARLEATERRTEGLILATSEKVWRSDAAQQRGAAGVSAFSGGATEFASRGAWLETVHPEDRERADLTSRTALGEGRQYVLEYRMRHLSGGFRWVEDRCVPIRDARGVVTEWVGVITDIDDRIVANLALAESEERLRLALHASSVGIWDVNLVTGIRTWSTDLKTILGLSAETEESEAALMALIHPDDREQVEAAHRNHFLSQPSLTFRIRRADTGEQRWILSSGRAVLDDRGRPIRRVGTFQDITERKNTEERLWAAANQDPLTGLHNRTLFQSTLDAAIATARADGMRIGLFVVDLDNFKEVNDTLGHGAGDMVLQVTAGRLRDTCPAALSVARLGGDEFAVLFKLEGELDDVSDLAGHVIQALALSISHVDGELSGRASLGCAVFPDHDENGNALLKHADLALYAAKRNGRCRYAIFVPAMKTSIHRRVLMLQRARDALVRRDILPFYQPKVSMTTREVCGFEALLRWRDGSGLRLPDALSEAFTDPQIAAQIGQLMLERVMMDIAHWRAVDVEVGSVALNVSAAEFESADVTGRWLAALDQSRVPARMLQMEVTETVLLGESSGTVARIMGALHAAGISIALDDFGTGYASLTHLRHYPVDWLKIDQSFIRDLATDSSAQAIVMAVIDLAHNMNLRVVAEGVETREQAGLLEAWGCDLAQGFLAAKPMPASRVPAFLRNWRGLAGPHRQSSVA